MIRAVLILTVFVFCARTAAADKAVPQKISSPSRTVYTESLPSVRIVSPCEDPNMDGEESFWCTVDLAVKQKNLAPCKRDMWTSTSSCLYEVKKEFAFTAEDCKKAFEHKAYQEACAKVAVSK